MDNEDNLIEWPLSGGNNPTNYNRVEDYENRMIIISQGVRYWMEVLEDMDK